MTSAEDVKAVRPQRGRVVHLWAAGYRRPRPPHEGLADGQALCGVAVYANGTPPGEPLEQRITDLPTAVVWSTFEPSTSDPRPTWVWCTSCLGHLVVLRGMQRDVLTLPPSTEEVAG